MSNIQLLQNISDQVNKMEDEGEVDLSILDNLNKLQTETKRIESKWTEKTDTNSFYFYNALKCVELIIEKMIDRFTKSKQNHDNPQVALDTLALIPHVVDVVEIAEEDKIDEQTIEKIIQKTYQLRNKAADTDLLESEGRNLEGINEQKILQTLDGMIEQLGIAEELPDDVNDIDDDEDLS